MYSTSLHAHVATTGQRLGAPLLDYIALQVFYLVTHL